jgi:hypothetical protein
MIGNGTITASDDNGGSGGSGGVGGVDGIREQNNTQVQEIKQLKEENQNLKERLDRIEKMLSMNAPNVTPAKVTVQLTSNPNPANEQVTIRYEMPETYTNATLIIRDLTGKEMKRFQLSDCCGALNVDTSELNNGTYLQTLIHQNKVLATQKMVIVK